MTPDENHTAREARLAEIGELLSANGKVKHYEADGMKFTHTSRGLCVEQQHWLLTELASADKRANDAVAQLATIERETIERCAREIGTCERYPPSDHPPMWRDGYSNAAADIANLVRALAKPQGEG